MSMSDFYFLNLVPYICRHETNYALFVLVLVSKDTRFEVFSLIDKEKDAITFHMTPTGTIDYQFMAEELSVLCEREFEPSRICISYECLYREEYIKVLKSGDIRNPAKQAQSKFLLISTRISMR